MELYLDQNKYLHKISQKFTYERTSETWRCFFKFNFYPEISFISTKTIEWSELFGFQVTAELKVITNLPTLKVEEVGMTASTDEQLMAPEEVKKKVKGEIKAKEERTDTDKKRERRRKKIRQRWAELEIVFTIETCKQPIL